MNDNRFHDSFDRLGREAPSDFERQLREFQPVAPHTSWDDIEASLSTGPKVSIQRPQPLLWRKMATHAAATLVGIGIGAVVMLMLNAEGANDVNHDAGVAAQSVSPLDSSENLQVITQTVADEVQPRSFAVAGRGRMNAVRRGPLTPMDWDIESRDWRNVSYDRLSSNAEPTSLDPSDVCQPMTAPQLLRELLDEQSEVSGGRGITTNSG